MIERKSLIPDGSVIPVPEHRRVATDVCCTFICLAYVLVLFILGIVFYSTAGVHSAYFAFENANTAANTTLANDYYGFLTSFWALIVTALGLGLLWMTLLHFLPQKAPQIAHICAAVVLIVLGVVILVAGTTYYNSNSGWKIAIPIICFILAIIILVMMFVYSSQIRLQGIFLDYARNFLNDWVKVYLYIPFFMLLTAGFIALIMFQHLAFSSKGVANSDLWNFANPGFLGILNIIEFIWGFQFLRDAFNFCVSGSATDWFWNTERNTCSSSLARLLTRHFGSVCAGSFINGFLELPTLVLQLFICHPEACCKGLGSCCMKKCCLGYFFNLVRTDSYSYINLAGEPFCNSGRECADICNRFDRFVGGYNPLKYYRFVASTFLVALLYLLGSIYVDKRVVNFYWWQNVVLILISYAVVVWFVDITADAAEAISTSFFAEYRFCSGYEDGRDYDKVQVRADVELQYADRRYQQDIFKACPRHYDGNLSHK